MTAMTEGGVRNLRVDGERLWASLMELARIGATPKGGVCRLAASDVDAEARRLFIGWCEAAGCAVRVDRIGNIFARRSGRDPSLPPVMTGSHLDTQPTGGKFDGAYGVMAALEVVRTLNDLCIETLAPIEIVAWTNEEGSRFSPAMVGSGVFAGVFDLAYGLDRPDNTTGVALGAELERIGFAGAEPVGGRPVAAYFEAHIEQGPILEAAGLPIGVVTGAQGQRWYEVTVTGQEAHAGPTPMPRRRDALVGAARMIDMVNRIGHAHAPYACATVGFVQISPNSRNTIPGRVFFTVDLRHPEDAVLTQMDRELRQACAAAAAAIGLEAEVTEFWYFPPTPFDPVLVGAVRDAATAQGCPHQDIISGAGHDAVYMARITPTAMIFVPCVGGISHNEIENAKPEDLTAGCNVLLNAVLDRANTEPPSRDESSNGSG
jgi:beta-ureidopropionase / N-carbamoyl-L-amino-acid hydrolase